jgi:hypothetical protein
VAAGALELSPTLLPSEQQARALFPPALGAQQDKEPMVQIVVAVLILMASFAVPFPWAFQPQAIVARPLFLRTAMRSPEGRNVEFTNALGQPLFGAEAGMAQQIVSWFVSNGRFRVQAINAVGRRKGRIIEVEEVDSRERFYGPARKMQRLVETLRMSSGEFGHDGIWTPDTNP